MNNKHKILFGIFAIGTPKLASANHVDGGLFLNSVLLPLSLLIAIGYLGLKIKNNLTKN